MKGNARKLDMYCIYMSDNDTRGSFSSREEEPTRSNVLKRRLRKPPTPFT